MRGQLDGLVASWLRSLKARNLAAKTLRTYGQSADQLVAHLEAEGVTDPADVRREHVEGFIAHLLDTRSAATASVRYRALQQFFAWCEAEDEIVPNPMERMRPPVVPERGIRVLSDGEVKALLATCSGTEFADRRDAAILRVFLDCGVRLAELAGLRVDDLDLDEGWVVVMGKGRRTRIVPFGAKTLAAVDRYLRARARHRKADSPKLWLATNHRSPLTDNGIGQLVRARGREAGIHDLGPHMLRHTWASDARLAGLDDASLMQLAGWKSRSMLTRYGKTAAQARAIEIRRGHTLLGDRI